MPGKSAPCHSQQHEQAAEQGEGEGAGAASVGELVASGVPDLDLPRIAHLHDIISIATLERSHAIGGHGNLHGLGLLNITIGSRGLDQAILAYRQVTELQVGVLRLTSGFPIGSVKGPAGLSAASTPIPPPELAK